MMEPQNAWYSVSATAEVFSKRIDHDISDLSPGRLLLNRALIECMAWKEFVKGVSTRDSISKNAMQQEPR